MTQLTLDRIQPSETFGVDSPPAIGTPVVIRTRSGVIHHARLNDTACHIIGPVWDVAGLHCWLPITNAAKWWHSITP